MQRKDNLIIWGFFSIAYIGSYTLLKQQGDYLANNAYLLSAFISISLTFMLDRYMKKHQAPKDKRSNLQKKSPSKITSGEKKPKKLQEKATRVVPLNHSNNRTSKGKKKKKAN